MVKKINVSLMNVGKLTSIDFVVIHNDYGSMTPEQYVNWLRGRNKNLGIAHYYITKDCIARVIDTYNIGYHTGEWNSNCRSIGYEVCQSRSASDVDFIANEDMTLMQATEDLIFYGLPINHQTVRLHHEFVSTSCPHRSLELHGNTTQSVKNYFISRMKYFATLGKTVDEMLGNKKTLKQPQTTSNNKTLDQLADEVIRGIWGNGKERIQRLSNAGYNPVDVQRRVDEKKGKIKPSLKPLDEVAREVINGKWGNGQDRINRLTRAGYNHNDVQAKVNEILG
ncbi:MULTISPECIES: N-acetylmuramoyl-L-alanine amidase [unclassified Gemella]|uniref:N-acetylmuramoyl-L-alanine amidase n=1 Tax=unclassified Gemella TaxID=2624949 RepID=UPI0010746D04|nr:MULTISPECIES: N-acetylmuramoyl-L-alanine amidase [unclassified Gemella]MBF0710455.1 N-acetylmuramoyl-L-alanine amidase [Gemella sp. GL1.1]MBF0746604.1 N-acetylmuramoyl-L-alanine amidase [Gemella sp. 19428wG2_WT2a]NYS27799.1 N-acetylmuramoyl-L-alanine amidase [Gemella sp. GL1]TFU59959.1 lysozyme [Gemella sp. WT2a]